jgi:carboxypeptidase Q
MDLINQFLLEEGALAKVQVSSRDAGVLGVTRGASYDPKGQQSVTGLVLSVEHYDKLARWLQNGQSVELEIDVQATFHTHDPQAYNTVAEIEGGKKKREVVLMGAHLDSWQAGTGATDNASGVAVMMEAARLLKTVDAPLARTVRIVLWSGEEQGLLGSRAYVAQHFATRPAPPPEQLTLPSVLRDQTWPITPKKEHGDVAAYFNLDNGAGRIRGIYGENNAAVQPIFAAWLAPFADLGAQTVSLQKTRGTDHVSFQEVGLPGFEFIQDPLAYETRTHHTNLDVLENVVEEDLKQAAVIVASFVYLAANRDQMLPRSPMPQAPPADEQNPHRNEAVASSQDR